MKFNYIASILLAFICSSSFSQTKEDVTKIIANYNLENIKLKRQFYEKKEEIEKQKALEAAKLNGWPIIINGKDGSFQELMRLTPDGFPIYYSTDNANAARSTRTNFLNTGGALGLNLNGQGMIARVWDGGTVRRTHNLLSPRVTTVDDPSGTSYSDHATHVTGTVIANNSVGSTKGMAYQATARTFNWTNDQSEALNEIVGGMLLSNHSYGVPVTGESGTTLPAWYIGAYTSSANAWDDIVYNAPYYLPVMSAGNDGNNNNNTNPIASGFDKLTGNKTAKNIMVVANANDAIITSTGMLLSVSINTSSSQGPTDDRRIKPDIAGNGTGVTSSVATSNSATASFTGTSMASPNVTGTLLLLQQHHKNITNRFMKASTLKGLACHTADDAGVAGPDPKFGWGLLNAKKAAETISNNGLTSWISEETLDNNETYTMTVYSDGTASIPLIASITWTDLPGNINDGTSGENDSTPVLVNDLDIRISKDGTTYYPWKLESNPNELATRNGDNNVDNVEQIKIDAPSAGFYTITITHKGNLVSNKQDYSLIVTGINSNFAIIPNSDNPTQCSNTDAIYTFDYIQTGSFTTNFSATGLPVGATVNFNPPSMSSNGSVTMTINLTNSTPGDYNIGIVGDNGTETETRYKTLKFYSDSFQPVNLIAPSNNNNTVSTSTIFEWTNDFNSETYTIQIATDVNFNNIILDTTLTDNSYAYSGLNEETVYYWRVIQSNRCGAQIISSAIVNNFITGKLTCGNSFSATDFSNANIGTTENSIASVPITVTGGLTIGDINVELDISHTYIQDMTYYLEGPVEIGSPIIKLFQEPCGDNDNIICTLDDSGSDFTCNFFPPAISGTVKPLEPLSTFNQLSADGIWTLRVVDPYNGDGGSINSVTLQICGLEASPLSTISNNINNIKIYPNPVKDNLYIDLPNDTIGNTTYALMDIQGRIVLTKKSNNLNERINTTHLTDGVYLLTIENNLGKTSKKVIIN